MRRFQALKGTDIERDGGSGSGGQGGSPPGSSGDDPLSSRSGALLPVDSKDELGACPPLSARSNAAVLVDSKADTGACLPRSARLNPVSMSVELTAMETVETEETEDIVAASATEYPDNHTLFPRDEPTAVEVGVEAAASEPEQSSAGTLTALHHMLCLKKI